MRTVRKTEPVTSDGAPGVRDLTRTDFAVLWPVTTRWSDNDMFGHLNNAVYYELFDSAINGWLIESAHVDEVTSAVIGVVAESGCTYFRELAFPEPLTVGVRATRIGRTSVTFQLSIFGDPQTPAVAAVGHWVQVYVDRDSRRPVPVPDAIRSALASRFPC
jgi:acyl-CoA thioester hydrolase